MELGREELVELGREELVELGREELGERGREELLGGSSSREELPGSSLAAARRPGRSERPRGAGLEMSTARASECRGGRLGRPCPRAAARWTCRSWAVP